MTAENTIHFSDTKYDDRFNSIDTLKWLPWVGKHYHESRSVKMLVVGESNYKWAGEDEETEEKIIGYLNCRLFTRNVINNYLTGKPMSTKIYKNITAALFYNDTPQEENKVKLWNTICYYNFIQRFLDSLKTEDRPIYSDWESGWSTFFKVIDVLRSNYVLFCGVTAAQYHEMFEKHLFNQDFCLKGKITVGEKIGSTYSRKAIIAKGNDYMAPITFIKHPSAFFSEKWIDYLHKSAPEFYKELCGQCGEAP